jgi:hypothetical protein
MRGRIILFVILAVVLALVGVYVGWSTNTPTAVGEPATATSSDLSVGSTQAAGSAQPRVSLATNPKTSAPKASPPKATAGHATQPSQTPSTPPTSPPRRAGPVRYGQVTTAGRPNEILISDDRRALATTFSEFEVIIGPASAEPSVTKSFSMTLPLTDGAKGEKLKIYASGFANTIDGATAQLTLRAGKRTIVRSFPSGSDDEYVEILELPATPGTTYQLSAVIEIHKDAAGGGDGYLNAVSIESEIS